jgi:hypothetical protein
MADSKIQIAVEVVGADKANKQIQSLENSSIDLKEGVSGVGEGFKSVGDLVKAQGGLMGDAFGTLGDSVIAVTDSVFIFKEGMATAGATGAKAWLGLLGPIAAVVGAVALAVDAYRQFSGSAQKAEEAQENMAAAASDTASRLEAMVEAGINLGTKALKEFINVNTLARLSMEGTIKYGEKLSKTYENLANAENTLNNVTEENYFMVAFKLKSAQEDLTKAQIEHNKALDEYAKKQEEANKKNKEAFELQELLIKPFEEFTSGLVEQRLRYDELQTILLESSKLRDKERLAIENSLKRKNDLINEEIRYKNEMRSLELQLKTGKITQDKFDESNKKLRTSLQNNTKELKDINDQLDPYARKVQNASESTEKLRVINDEAAAKSFENRQKIFDRQVELINREKQEIIDLATERSQIFDKELKSHIKDMSIYKTRKFELTQEAEIVDNLTKKYKIYYTVSDLLNKNYDDLSESSKDYLDLLLVMNKDFEKDLTQKSMLFTGSTEQHLKLSKMIVEQTQEKIAETLVEADLKILDAQREYQLKNRKQLNLSQKQIEEDYAYHTKRTVDLAKKEAKERFLVALENTVKQRESIRANTLEYSKMMGEFDLSKLEADKKIAQMRYENQDKSERSRLDLLNQVNELEVNALNYKISHEEKYLNKSLNLIQDNLDMEISLYKEMYSVQGQITVEGNDKILEAREEAFKKRREVEEKNDLLVKNSIILKEEILQKQRNVDLENYLYEKKYGEDRLSLLETLFLTEEQIRERATEHIDGFSSENIEIQRDETRKQRIELEKRLQDQIKYEQALAKGHKQIAEDTMVNLAKEISFDPKNEAELRQNELRIKALKDSYDLEIGLYRYKEEQIAEIQAKGTIEKDKLLKKETDLTKKYKAKQVEQEFKTFNTVGQMLKDFGDSSTQALISSGVAAAFAGENIANALKQTLRGLAQEATAKSLLEGAYALGALAMGDEKGASMHGLAALKFGMAAIAVGAMSAIGGSPATGGGASSTTSPTATPQATATETRPEARDTQPIVYNINFGGSVIYDTREAAMRAFSNQITQLQSRAVRGTQSARMMNRG